MSFRRYSQGFLCMQILWILVLSQFPNHAQSKLRVLLVARIPDYTILWYFWSLIVCPLIEISIFSLSASNLPCKLANHVGPPAETLTLFHAWLWKVAYLCLLGELIYISFCLYLCFSSTICRYMFIFNCTVQVPSCCLGVGVSMIWTQLLVVARQCCKVKR